MPKNLTSTGTTFPTQTSPIPGEPRTAGSVETPFQNAADRATYLKDRLDHIDPTKEGARRIRRVASISTLQSLTDYPDKTIIEVDGYGLYQFDGASTATELSPVVIKPSNIGSSSAGRWIIAAFGYSTVNAANGIPQLDANAKVPGTRLAICDGTSGRVTGSNVVYGRAQLITNYGGETLTTLTADGVFKDVATSDVGVTLAIGDLVLVDYNAEIQLVGSDLAGYNIRVTEPNATQSAITAAKVKAIGSNVGQRVQASRHFTATQAGTHTFVLRAFGENTNASTGQVFRVYTRIEVVKP